MSFGSDGTATHTVNSCFFSTVVTSNADSGPGSLRQAILDTCQGGDISFDMGSVVSPIGLTSGELELSKDVVIDGPGADQLTIERASGSFRLFSVKPGVGAFFAFLTLANGDATTSPGGGGAIRNEGGLLQLAAVDLVGNTAQVGGAIANGDGVNQAVTFVIDSTLRGNVAIHEGGAIINLGADNFGNGGMGIYQSTISGNAAGTEGGGVYNTGANGYVEFFDSTVTLNRADKDSSGIGTGGGLHNDPESVPIVIGNTIVAGNFAGASPASPDDVSGALDSFQASYNLIGVDTNLNLDSDGTNIIGTAASPVDPRLGPLANNGGGIMTHMPLAGSPALDAGNNDIAQVDTLCSCVDQRGPGFLRVRTAAGGNASDPTVDIGAVEADPTIEAIAPKTIIQGTPPLSFVFAVGDTDTAFDSIVATSSNQVLVADAGLSITGSGSSRTLTITPNANRLGTATITVTATKTIAGTVLAAPDTFVLTVNPVPTRIIGISADLTFGSVSAGTTATRPMIITNSGTLPLTVTSLTYPAGFSGNFAGGSIPAGGTQLVTVTFAPAAAIGYGGTVTVNADQTSGTSTTFATGTGTGPAPVITQHPQNVAVHPDGPASFTAAAVGNPTPTVQWQISTDGGATWTDLAGATAATYTIGAVAIADSGHRFRAVFTNASGTATTDSATLTVRHHARADLDGDGLSDLVVWHPATGTWSWVLSSKNFVDDGLGTKQWGNSSLGDVPLVGDIDGDGKADLIVWRASTGTWYWLTSSSGYSYAAAGGKQWGNQSLGDVPLVGDIDGDGKTDLIVWRASTGTWFWLTSSSGYSYAAAGGKQWGNSSLGDVPLLGDVDGDGLDDLAIWRASTGTWYWITAATGYAYANAGAKQWGNLGLGDVPQFADIDGDGKADLTVWRASTGTWFWLTSSTGYSYASADGKQWGNFGLGDVPLAGDFDTSGRASLTVWRASTGTWYWLTPSTNYNYASAGGKPWGVSGDIPMVK